MNLTAQTLTDNSKKSVLARACDPVASKNFASIVPSLIGDAEYIFATGDDDFIKKLESRKWSVVFFAPGACRFSAANRDIPGSNSETKTWSLEEYKALVIKLQGPEIQIVESLTESETITLLNEALNKARTVK